MIIADINSQGVAINLLGFEKAYKAGVPKALMDVAFEVLRLSQFEVPHDVGTLQNSGTVELVDEDVVLGYHTPYAARLHEHPEYRFQKGRKGKYLEDPINNNAEVLGIKFGRSLQTRLF